MSAIFPNFGKVAEIRNAFPNSEAFTNSKISRTNYRSAIWLRNCDLALFWYFFYICFLTMLDFLFKGSLIIISKVNFCRSYLMMAIFKYEECTQNSHYWIWPWDKYQMNTRKWIPSKMFWLINWLLQSKLRSCVNDFWPFEWYFVYFAPEAWLNIKINKKN